MFLFLTIECPEETRESVLIAFEKGDVVCSPTFEERIPHVHCRPQYRRNRSGMWGGGCRGGSRVYGPYQNQDDRAEWPYH